MTNRKHKACSMGQNESSKHLSVAVKNLKETNSSTEHGLKHININSLFSCISDV